MKKTILTAIFSLSVCGAVFAEDQVEQVTSEAIETQEVAIADTAEVSHEQANEVVENVQ